MVPDQQPGDLSHGQDSDASVNQDFGERYQPIAQNAPYAPPPESIYYPDASYTSVLKSGATSLEPLDTQGSLSKSSGGPSLPIILISAACGVAGGIFGLYISYGLMGLGIALSASLATMGMLFGLGISGAALTALTGQRGTLVNMVFSCTLILLVGLFMTLCATIGAVFATLLIRV